MTRPFEHHGDVLARLVSQAAAAESGVPGPNIVALRALVEEASALGAARALERLGLEDARAKDDIDELRELLSAWRDAKTSAWKAAIDWLVRACLALVLVGIAVRLGAVEMLR